MNIQVAGQVATVYLSGEIDHHLAKRMREEIDEMIHRTLPKLLILDFSAVSFMDSSGIGLVMGRYRLMESIGGDVEINGAEGRILRMMQMAGIAKIVKL